MPTDLPDARAGRAPLTGRQKARLIWLNLRFISLTRRLSRAVRRSRMVGPGQEGGKLLRISRKWLAVSAEIGGLLGDAEPPEVRAMREIFEGGAAERMGGDPPGGCASRPDRGHTFH